MAKEAYYFSHDFGARNDPKLQKVLMKLGQEGKGVYWDLVEMLFEEGGKLFLSECDSYAFALRTDEKCITSLLVDFDLFKKDSIYFWSDSVNRRILERESKSNKARLSANSRWNNANASKNNANALRDGCEGNAIKESKEKENVVSKDTVGLPLATPTSNISFESRCDGFIKKFNEIKLSKYKVTDKVKTKLKARLKNYTSVQIINALKIAIKDPHHVEQNLVYVTPEFILREDILERYLNSDTKNKNSVNSTVYVAPQKPINHKDILV